MKKILTILLLLVAGATLAQQKTPQTVSALNTQGVAKDQFKVDSFLYLPLTDTIRNPGRAGVVIVKASDLNPYIYNGTKWVSFGSTADLALKLNISDTASMLSSYLRKTDTTGKWVTAILRRTGTDSVFYVKGGSQIFAYRDSSGGGGSTPTLQQVLTAGNRITISPQLIKGTGPTILQWDSLTNINWRYKGFYRFQADGGQASLVMTQTAATVTAADGFIVSTPSAGFFVLPPSLFSRPVTVLDTLKLPNAILKSLDTINYKLGVYDAAGNGFKMNWPISGSGSGSADSLKHLFVDTSTNRNNYVLTFDSVNHKWILAAPGSGGGGSGTVNQVNTGLWLSGGPITNTGTIIADSAAMAAYFLRRKDSTVAGYQTHYDSDTSRTNIYNAINGKQPTGNYITSLTGPITASGPGAAAATITNNAVTYAKIQAAAGQGLLGATGAGNYQLIALGTNLSMSGSTLNATGSGGGGMDSTFQKLNWISVDSFGARGDGFSDTTGNITSGTNIFTSTNAHFTSSDVGKYFAVGGAGAAGVELITTISGFTNSTTVTLTVNAGTTVSNAKYKYGTDNTTFIQNAINYAATFPAATLYFRSGRYFINGAPVTNVGGYNPNSQLYIPLGHYAPSAYQPVIRLLGATPPNLFIDFAAGQAPPNSGTIIESMRTDSAAAVLGTVAENAIYGTFNWRMVYLENMQFRTKTDNQVTDIKPLMTGINFLNQNFVGIENCRIETSSATQSSVKPDTAAVGIFLPGINNGGNNQVNNLMVQGFHRGIVANENTHLDNITIAACWRMFEIDSSYHTVYVGRMLGVWCPYKVFIPQSQAYFDIAQLDIEHYDAAGPVWFRDSLDLDAPNMIHGSGRINYFIQVAFAGEAVQTFTRNDNFLLSNINVMPVGYGWNIRFPGGNTVEWKLGQNLHASYPAHYVFQTAANTATHLDLARGATTQYSLGMGLVNPADNDYYLYNAITGHVREYIDPAENISFGGPQAHVNPALKIWEIGSHVTMAANDTVMGALFADSSKFGFITTGGAPMMHWQMPSATLGQKDYYQYIDDGHMYWETVDNGGTPHIFLQMTQSAGVPLYTTVPTGNLGVNVATPTEKLEVGGNAVFTQAKITNSVAWSHPIELGVETTLPAISMHYAGGPSDQKNWDWYFDGTNLILRSIDDGITSTQNAYEIKRSGVNITSVSFPNGKVGIKTNTPDSVLHVVGSEHLTGTIRADAIPAGVGTKALRYNPSTGIFSYADTTTGGGASDTLKLAFAGTGERPFYAHIDTLFGKTLKGLGSVSVTSGTDSTINFQLTGFTTGRIPYSSSSSVLTDNANLKWDATGNTLVIGGGTGALTQNINATGNSVSGNFGNSGGNRNLIGGGTFTDNTTAASGSKTYWFGDYFAGPTYAATNSSVTYNSISTAAFVAPTAGTNITATHRFALRTFDNSAGSGNMLVDGGTFMGGGIYQKLATITSNYTATSSDFQLLVDATGGNITITLPAVSSVFDGTIGVGIIYSIKRMDASGNTVTVQRAGSDTIDGATSFTLTTQYQSKSIQAGPSSAWYVY